jgi:hypothetical protein
MASILKVDTIQDQSGNNIINENADTITIGASGDTVTITIALASGATLPIGTATGIGKVLQVVTNFYIRAYNFSSCVMFNTLSVSITPSCASNKILVFQYTVVNILSYGVMVWYSI